MRQFLYLSLSIWILISSCNESILVGSVLIEDESLQAEFTDGMDVTAKTILGEEAITFRKALGSTFSASTYMVGNIEGPVFGKTEATSYFSPSLLSAYPSFSENTLDSVVLSIPLDSLGFYGDLTAVHNVELRALSESIESLLPNTADTLFSNEVVNVEPTILSSISSVISYKDSSVVIPYINPDTIVKIRPELRMPMDTQFWIDLVGPLDTLTAEDLEQSVPGFELRSTPNANSIFGLDFSFLSNNSAANLIFYYRIGDTTKTTYVLPLGNFRHSLMTNDYSGSELVEKLDDVTAEQLYIQSMAGTNIEVDLSSIKTITDKILNYGELELTVLPEDEDLYQPISSVLAWYRNEDGDLDLIRQPATDPLLNESYSGGTRKLTYSIDLTSHLIRLRNDTTITNDKIILIPVSKSQRPNRSIILGANHPDNPLKLNLILTKP